MAISKTVICKDIEGKEEEVLATDLVFRPSVYAVIIKDQKILLSKQWDGYDFPGGGVDLGETINEGLEREVREETGLKVSIGRVIACENSFFKIPFKNIFSHCILMYYLCEVKGGELSKDNFDENEKNYADMPEWISLENLEKIKFYNSVDSLKIIRDAVKLLKI